MPRRDKLQQMLQDSPDDPFLLYALAMEERAEGNDTAALDQLGRVIALDPQYVAAYFQQGQILAGGNQIEPAREALRRGITVARRVGDAHAAAEMTEFLDTLTGD